MLEPFIFFFFIFTAYFALDSFQLFLRASDYYMDLPYRFYWELLVAFVSSIILIFLLIESHTQRKLFQDNNKEMTVNCHIQSVVECSTSRCIMTVECPTLSAEKDSVTIKVR